MENYKRYVEDNKERDKIRLCVDWILISNNAGIAESFNRYYIDVADKLSETAFEQTDVLSSVFINRLLVRNTLCYFIQILLMKLKCLIKREEVN